MWTLNVEQSNLEMAVASFENISKFINNIDMNPFSRIHPRKIYWYKVMCNKYGSKNENETNCIFAIFSYSINTTIVDYSFTS